jgi:hypothetical protein
MLADHRSIRVIGGLARRGPTHRPKLFLKNLVLQAESPFLQLQPLPVGLKLDEGGSRSHECRAEGLRCAVAITECGVGGMGAENRLCLGPSGKQNQCGDEYQGTHNGLHFYMDNISFVDGEVKQSEVVV